MPPASGWRNLLMHCVKNLTLGMRQLMLSSFAASALVDVDAHRSLSYLRHQFVLLLNLLPNDPFSSRTRATPLITCSPFCTTRQVSVFFGEGKDSREQGSRRTTPGEPYHHRIEGFIDRYVDRHCSSGRLGERRELGEVSGLGAEVLGAHFSRGR